MITYKLAIKDLVVELTYTELKELHDELNTILGSRVYSGIIFDNIPKDNKQSGNITTVYSIQIKG